MSARSPVVRPVVSAVARSVVRTRGQGDTHAPDGPVFFVPTAPLNVVAVAGDAQATVSFDPPADDGGSAITGYTVTSSPGGFTATGTGSPIVVTGLTNGTPYTFTVTATNAVGNSAASAASDPATPTALASLAALRAAVIAMPEVVEVFEVRPPYCWQDTAGVTPADAADAIGRIDGLKNGYNMLQATVAAKPLLVQDGTRFYTLVDGVNDAIGTVAVAGVLVRPMSVFCASDYTAGTSAVNQAVFGVQKDANNYFGAGQVRTPNTAFAAVRVAANGVAATLNQLAAGQRTPGTPNVLRAEFTSNALVVQVDSNPEVSVAVAAAAVTPAAAQIGVSLSAYPEKFYGGVVVHGILGATDRQTVKRYLDVLCGREL